MGDKEILAEYKIAYIQLQDIIDNADEQQISAEEVDKIVKVMNDIALLYEKIYKRIKEQKDISLYYRKNLLVADKIFADYIEVNDDIYITYDDDMYISYKDLEKKPNQWWEDYDFLVKF